VQGQPEIGWPGCLHKKKYKPIRGCPGRWQPLLIFKYKFLYLGNKTIIAMIKFRELKVGDYVMAEFEGRVVQGEVTELQRDQKLACVNDGVQDFWFDQDHLQPIPLDEEQLKRLNFTRQENEDGSVKYMKGAFRILLHAPGKFSDFEIWYREDRRHINGSINLHDLQNHYLDMTKVHLTNEKFA
jgi:hypothetical protein